VSKFSANKTAELTKCSPDNTSSNDNKLCPSLKSSNRSSTRLETWRQKIIKYEWNFSVKIGFIIFICFQTITIHSLPFRTSINIYIHSQYLWGKKSFFSRRWNREQQNTSDEWRTCELTGLVQHGTPLMFTHTWSNV